jgi:ornithine decarboxylase
MLLKLLAYLGAGFDCASKNEIQSILDLGVSPDRIIYANPCKQASYIKYAYQNGVNTTTFDNDNELYKIKEHHPNAKIVLRIITNDANAICKFSMKFGANMPTAYKLIDLAIKLDLDLIGISFHVGSGQMSPAAFSESIQNARELFDYAQNEHGLRMSFLDLGGGFPGSPESMDLFKGIAKEINNALDTYFPLTDDVDKNVRVIAEPGRYYACSAFTLTTNVIAKRTIEEENAKSFMYYINDGVYASFNCMFYDHADDFQPIIIKVSRCVFAKCLTFIGFKSLVDSLRICQKVCLAIRQAYGDQHVMDLIVCPKNYKYLNWKQVISCHSETWAPTLWPVQSHSTVYQSLSRSMLRQHHGTQ